MNELKIIKAVYYHPEIGPERGTDVTAELSAQIRNGALFYNGIYNSIFVDHFKGVYKRLKIELEFKGERFTKFYNEDEKINLPDDIGKITSDKEEGEFDSKWYERWWVKYLLFPIIVLIIGGIILYFVFGIK